MLRALKALSDAAAAAARFMYLPNVKPLWQLVGIQVYYSKMVGCMSILFVQMKHKDIYIRFGHKTCWQVYSDHACIYPMDVVSPWSPPSSVMNE